MLSGQQVAGRQFIILCLSCQGLELGDILRNASAVPSCCNGFSIPLILCVSKLKLFGVVKNKVSQKKVAIKVYCYMNVKSGNYHVKDE